MKYAMLRGENIVAIYENPSPEDVSALGLVGLAHQGQIPPQPSQSHVLRAVDDGLAWVDVRTLAQVKAQKNAEINSAHERANMRFEFAGHWFQADARSWQQITAVQGYVSDSGRLPPGFPGRWKSEDNQYLPINDAAEWRLFYAAAVARGTANFMTSEALKLQLEAAQTIDQVEAVKWPNNSPHHTSEGSS